MRNSQTETDTTKSLTIHTQITPKTHSTLELERPLWIPRLRSCGPMRKERSSPHRLSPQLQIILHAYTSVARKSLNVASLLPNSGPQRFLTGGIPHFRRASLKKGLGALFRV